MAILKKIRDSSSAAFEDSDDDDDDDVQDEAPIDSVDCVAQVAYLPWGFGVECLVSFVFIVLVSRCWSKSRVWCNSLASSCCSLCMPCHNQTRTGFPCSCRRRERMLRSLTVCLFIHRFLRLLSFGHLSVCAAVITTSTAVITNAPTGLIYSAHRFVRPCSTLIPQKTPSVPHTPSAFVSSSSVPLRQTYWCAMIASMLSLFDPNRHLFYR